MQIFQPAADLLVTMELLLSGEAVLRRQGLLRNTFDQNIFVLVDGWP